MKKFITISFLIMAFVAIGQDSTNHGNFIYNALPPFFWLMLLGFIEILLRLIPSSKPYYTVLGLLKMVLDLIIPDRAKDEVVSKSHGATVRKKRFWRIKDWR